MFMPVGSRLRLKPSPICDASPRQRWLTTTAPHRCFHLFLKRRCGRMMVLALLWVAVGVASPSETWAGTEEKQPLKLPEVVNLGQDVSDL